jgi:hypothetical protein
VGLLYFYLFYIEGGSGQVSQVLESLAVLMLLLLLLLLMMMTIIIIYSLFEDELSRSDSLGLLSKVC